MTMSVQFLAFQLHHIDLFGFPRQEALALLDITEDDLRNPLGRIAAAPVEQMFKIAAEAISDPRLGIRVGHKFRVHDYGKTGSIYSYCETMAEVFELNRRYQRVTIDIGQSEYLIENDRHYFLYKPYEDAKYMHHNMGCILGAWATALRWLSWAAGHELKEAHLIPKAPKDISFYQKVVQCPIAFGMPRNHVEFYPESITKPLVTRDAEKLAQSITILDKILERGDEAENFITLVRASIQAAMRGGVVSLASVAGRLDMPERRLRQKLSASDLSFRTMVEDERKRRFQKLHARGESFAAISQALAYNDQAAFTRAFKRWYGVSPGAYKGEHQDGEPA